MSNLHMNKTQHWLERLIPLPFFIWYMWTLVQTAWVSDDAFITFRSIENFIHGYGPIFNIGERVQTFTHPLWFLLQSLANWGIGLWRDNPLGSSRLYYMNILLSAAASGMTMLVFWFWGAVESKNAVLGLVVFTLSKAFMDYSTSGLENPLSHLLIAAFLAFHLTHKQNNFSRLYILSSLARWRRPTARTCCFSSCQPCFTYFWQVLPA